VKDKCVLCGKDTPYETTTPVGMRRHYIEGSGQLCEPCYVNVYMRT